MNPLFFKQKVRSYIVSSAEAKLYYPAMFELYSRYYQIEMERFLDRFESNDQYVIYWKGPKIIGFTGFRLKSVKTPVRTYQTIYFGHSVIHHQHRGKALIPLSIVKIYLKQRSLHPEQPIYVWCDALTYKPYLLFANYLKEYYPSRLQANSAEVDHIIRELGNHYYGETFNPSTGTVYKAQKAVSDHTTLIHENHLSHPDIAFYAEKNKKYDMGHGLIVIAPLSVLNFFQILGRCARKMVMPIFQRKIKLQLLP